jgi:molybdate transport system substrate-binding protein
VATLHIFSAGAAQAVVERIIVDYQRETGGTVSAEYGAVGAMKARILEGGPADVVILTSALIDELAAGGTVVGSSRGDLGKVGTGVAVRAGTPLPDVTGNEALRGNMLAATRIVCPDPAVATAGKIVVRLCEGLGIMARVRGKLQYFPNGYAAMQWLAQSSGELEMGITQITEILPNTGVTYAGPLPDEFQMKATYTAALAAGSADPDAAADFISRLTARAARPMLAAAGYELGE